MLFAVQLPQLIFMPPSSVAEREAALLAVTCSHYYRTGCTSGGAASFGIANLQQCLAGRAVVSHVWTRPRVA
ncbi:hypothetical protein E4U02_14615 [Microbacterium paludicola]|uniref:Uncharacterized protein n=1 Tax=Microbacterium paludicola TaxID=300019 RepID=A0A4Y9FPL3_9MICO|nr:hypothetical protein [Microbacterium paludicola]MBF0817636.1 hypothetical protein [Microbacterium paludicola]TFU30470.1 hypothetical protein E4U02_14615 [Microbacterium paludicola]